MRRDLDRDRPFGVRRVERVLHQRSHHLREARARDVDSRDGRDGANDESSCLIGRQAFQDVCDDHDLKRGVQRGGQ